MTGHQPVPRSEMIRFGAGIGVASGTLVLVVVRFAVVVVLACLVAAAAGGCVAPPSAPSSTGMSQALQQAAGPSDRSGLHASNPSLGVAGGASVQSRAPGSPEPDRPTGAIATVNGRPISRDRVVDLLLRSGGVGVLEQIVVLDEARRAAEARGLSLSEADVQREYDAALRMLSDPLAGITTGPLDRESAERSLRAVLADRNISHEEFALGMRRRAYLRRIVESTLQFTEQDLQTELSRRYGERVQVRHIQFAVPRNVDRIQNRLAAGEDFAEIARLYSANLASAEEGGLLQPFSRDDPVVPELFRKTAFSLMVGEVSGAVRIGEWYHILKLERRLPAEQVPLESVRDTLLDELRERAIEPEMQRLYEKLFNNARIVIHDPVLGAAFEQAHPDRRMGRR